MRSFFVAENYEAGPSISVIDWITLKSFYLRTVTAWHQAMRY